MIPVLVVRTESDHGVCSLFSFPERLKYADHAAFTGIEVHEPFV